MKKNKTVLVTGASRGIGKAIALKFASEGYNVIINSSKSFNDLLKVSEEISKYKVKCLPIQKDISNFYEAKEMIEEINLVFPKIDCIVNNAGMSYIGLFTDTDYDIWTKIINTNLNSVYNICYHIVPSMIKEKSGSIINISSIWGLVGASLEVAYSTSKAGINGFTKSLAKELGPSNIRVNAIACGAIETDMNKWLTKEEKADFEDGISLCRFGKPEEVANLAYFLAENSSSYLTGEVIKLDGGAC